MHDLKYSNSLLNIFPAYNLYSAATDNEPCQTQWYYIISLPQTLEKLLINLMNKILSIFHKKQGPHYLTLLCTHSSLCCNYLFNMLSICLTQIPWTHWLFGLEHFCPKHGSLCHFIMDFIQMLPSYLLLWQATLYNLIHSI